MNELYTPQPAREAITMLGTGNAMCTRCYNTCFYLHSPEGGLLVDGGGGNGIFRQLYKAHINVTQVRHIFITHTHTDHLLGVVWMVRKISPMIKKGKFQGPLTIYCHDEAKYALENICSLLLPRKINSAMGDTIIVREVKTGDHAQIDGMDVEFFDIGSTKAKQFGFVANMPSGKRVVCLGDEPYNEINKERVHGCDWLLSEAFCLYDDRDIFNPYAKHHSTVIDAARLAEQLQVKNLLLYHTEDTKLSVRRLEYTAEAKRAYHGNVVVPDDLETVVL